MISSWTAIAVALITFSSLTIRYVLFIKRFPSAPGPKWGIVSRYWYVLKLWEGRFEQWNIEQHALHGKIVRVAPDMYSIDDIDAAKTIYGFSSNMPKSDWYSMFAEPGVPNHNLFSAEDRQFHSQMRRRVASMYSMTAIKSYEPYVDNCVSILLRQFDNFASTRQTFDLQRWMQCYAFDVIGEISFSTRVGFMESGGEDLDGIMTSIDKATMFSSLAGLDPKILAPLMFLKLGDPTIGLTLWTKKLTQGRESKDNDPEKRTAEDFYSKIETLRAKDPEAIEKYRANIALLMNVTAGSDTTSISLTAIMFYLASNPEMMTKLRQEILEGMAKGVVSEFISFDEAQKLPYLQAVIKEGMRLHPATGLPLWRVVQAPGETLAGKFFPSGTIVGINTWVAHRNKEVFGADANMFRPDRWDPAVTSPQELARMEQYYMPFGAGTRTCIGKNISILEMCKVLPELVKRFKFELVSKDMKHVNNWFVKQTDILARIERISSH